jgi:outer membrane protein assembly factor BamB
MRSFVGLLFCTMCSPVSAGDWPQILGPTRNGVAENEKIVDSFPPTGPGVIWESSVGSGFAGPSVLDGVAYVFHRIGDEEILEARHIQTGDQKWKVGFPSDFSASYSSDNGPRCVPPATKDRIYAFGAAGGLYCVDTKTGKKIWERQTFKEYKAQEGFFGAGSTPLLEGNLLIVNVGSRDGAGIVAFDAETGTTKWKSTDNQASYSSPIAATVGGTRHILVVTRYNTVSLNPKDGSVRFSFPFGARGPTVNGANPVVVKDKLFLTASYGLGSLYRRITDKSAEDIWTDRDGIASQYSTFVPSGRFLFGLDGRQDNGAGSASLVCFDPETQKVKWKESGFDYGSVILADNTLIILTNTGKLILARATTDAYTELARANVLSPASTGYRLPALSNGLLYVRDDSTLKCISLK